MSKYAIGIDLGTTFSCIAAVQDGLVKIIHTEIGPRTTPSYVAFTENERLIGGPAKTQENRNFKNTVFDIKRLIGRRFEDETVQTDIPSYPFNVINVGGRCGIQVLFKGETKTFTPEELSAMVLTKMKHTAEAVLREEVKDAVITVPAYFNDSQRKATIDAAEIAGLNVLRIINEPTAAGIAYLLNEKTPKQQNILVYDLGGGTFDVTVMTVEKESWSFFGGNRRSISVRSTTGDTHLGGQDFDILLVEFCATELQKKYEIDIRTNQRAMVKLRNCYEKAKRILSNQAQTTIEFEVSADKDCSLELTRARFEELCVHLFKKTLDFVDQALIDAKMSKEQIDEIILVGGSTRIPKIQRLLKAYFDGKELNSTVHPDEVVAYGAAVQAAILSGNRMNLVQNLRIQDVTPMTLGTDVTDGVFQRVIMRNTPIPARKVAGFYTIKDNQTRCNFGVYEGEHDLYKYNNFLGKFELFGIRQAPAGEVKFDAVFNIDENGILAVTATERGTNNTRSIRIDRNTGRLSREQMTIMIENEAKYVEDEHAQKFNDPI